MKILFYVHRFWPSIGGVESYVLELARALKMLGHEPMVVAGATLDDQPPNDSIDSIPIHRFPATRSTHRQRLWFLANLGLFRSADVVQVSNTHMLEHLMRMVGDAVERKRLFLTRHGMSGRFPVADSEKKRARRAQNLVAGVVHDGSFIERWLGVSPDICPEPGLNPEASTITPVAEPPPTSAVFVGRLEPDTGICTYLAAVRLLNADPREQFTLDVYGAGSLARELRERARCEHLPVTFHGACANARDRLTDGCFAFVDGRLSILDAFARRRLVVAAYQNDWKRDYLCGERFSRYLLTAGTAEELAGIARATAADDMGRKRRVDEAYAYARTLSWEKVARQFIDLWQSSRASLAYRALGLVPDYDSTQSRLLHELDLTCMQTGTRAV